MVCVSHHGVSSAFARAVRQLCVASCVVLIGCADDGAHEASDPLATVECPSSIDGGLLDASSDTSDAATPDAEVPDAGEQAVDAGPVRDPNEPYIESITANGTGCPPDSWKVEQAADGTQSVVFESYVLEIGPSQAQVSKDCQLAISVASPVNRRFALSSSSLSGNAVLEKGVTLELATYVGFQGTSVDLTSGHRIHIPRAPATTYDSDYVLRAQTEAADLQWSTCGTKRDLTVRTRATLQNGMPRANGYAIVARLGGEGRLAFTLVSRACD